MKDLIDLIYTQKNMLKAEQLVFNFFLILRLITVSLLIFILYVFLLLLFGIVWPPCLGCHNQGQLSQ